MKKLFKNMDKTLFVLMLVYTIIGLIMIFSSSSITAVLFNGVEETYFFTKQLVVVIASWALGLLFLLRFPTSKYKKLAPLGIVGIISVLALLIPYGTITNSAKSWFDLGKFSLQPSEFCKSIMIIFLAVYFEKIINKKDFSLNSLFVPAILALGAILLIALQPDLGTALILAGIVGLIFLALPIRTSLMKKTKLIGLTTGILVFFVFIFGSNFLNAEQASRLIYQAPCTRYTEKTGYQVCNGFIAISNGGLFGVGLGNSTQKYLYLPEAHTDFIFPIVIEELGTLVGILLILGYVLILFRLLRISKRSSTIRGSIIAYGTFAYILLHLIVNLMGVLALIPLTGVPVPFLSYGGSFYINLIVLLFICERVEIETNNNKTKDLIRSIK